MTNDRLLQILRFQTLDLNGRGGVGMRSNSWWIELDISFHDHDKKFVEEIFWLQVQLFRFAWI